GFLFTNATSCPLALFLLDCQNVNMSKDYYKILEVEKSASQDEVKRAFRKLAHKFHPDKKDGDEQKFKDVNEAYQILGDDKKRKTYDQYGSTAFENGGAGAGGFSGFDPRQGFGGGGVEFNMEDLGDMFGSMFGFGGGGGRQKKGRDIQVDVHLDFLEAIHGVTREVQLYKPSACSSCDGKGAEKGTEMETCDTCMGSGRVANAQRTVFGTVQVQSACTACSGQGKKPKSPCKACDGSGIKREEQKLQVQIPAGVDSDNVLTVRGQGEAVGPGGVPGDLHVRIRVRSHAEFHRDGHDIRSTARLPFSMLVLGGSVSVDTVDGKGDLKIPAGTDSGTIFKLRGKGVPVLNGRGRGDQYVTVQPIVTKAPNRETKKLIEQLRDEGM
ncbi:MAG: molecular chaperone DnaJ, partial [bacterium]|nr:molecular chaperone DnaJ [bacterium]